MVELAETNVWRCARCGAEVLGVPKGVEPVSAFRSASGEPLYRIVTVDGKEIHRCQAWLGPHLRP